MTYDIAGVGHPGGHPVTRESVRCTTWLGPDVVTLRISLQSWPKREADPSHGHHAYTLVYLLLHSTKSSPSCCGAKQMPFLNRYSIKQLKKEGYLDGSKANKELGWVPQISWRGHKAILRVAQSAKK